MQIFPHRDVDMWGVFKRGVLGGYEYLFGFETLIFVILGI